MQTMFGTILCILLKDLVLTKATITFISKDYTLSNSLQKENVSMYPDLSFTQSYSENIARNEREVDEVTLANTSIIPESTESNLNKPTSLRAFVEFDSQFTEKVNDIFVTLRWNQSEFTDEIIQGYTVQCFFIDDLKEKIQICDDKNITTTKLEHTVHNLKPNTTYYFRVRAHTEVFAGPYSNLIEVSTTHENPIPKLLLVTSDGIHILDLDSNIVNNLVEQSGIGEVAYWAQEHKIYWIQRNNLMTLDITENNVTKIAEFDFDLRNPHLCIDWVARNLYMTYHDTDYFFIAKFDLTMWENGIIKFDEIFKAKETHIFDFDLIVSPSMGILYRMSYNWKNTEYDIMKYHLDEKNEQIFRINEFVCKLNRTHMHDIIIDNMNNEDPLIYWKGSYDIIVSNTNRFMCYTILQVKSVGNIRFLSMTINKTNIYILAYNELENIHYIFISKKESHEKINMDGHLFFQNLSIKILSSDYTYLSKIYAFDKSLQPYPPMRCLTPYGKVYNFENVTATTNSIIVNLPKPIAKSGCKNYKLPITIYTISVRCLDNNLNKSEKFNVQTYERYYEIQNLIPLTEYKLKFTLSNFYFDQLSMNPFNSDVISIKTNSSKPNAPENVSVLALTPTIAVVHWMPLKKVKCQAMTYEVHWKSISLMNGTQQKSKQSTNVPKRMADGRFFTKINLSPVQDYSIYVRVYPSNFSDFYNESLGNIDHIYSEPNNITLSGVNINSMNISWISNINLTFFSKLKYKDIATEKWQTTNYVKINDNKEIIYHIENLQSGTSYQFRLILMYPEYEETFTWPVDERFIFSTRGSKRDISSTPGIIPKQYYLLFMLGFFVIIIIICICYFYRLYRQRKNNNEQLLSSTMVDMELAILHEISCRHTEVNMIYSPLLHYNPDECAITKIAREQITLTKCLGSGAFGMVFQGNVKNLERSGTEISAAIKVLRKDASSQEKKKFLEEAKLMNHFQHKHILRLLAICLDEDSPLLVLELMETGDLLNYLRDCRILQTSDSHALRVQDLLAMCEDVARGCCYLEELRFIHRDLACRNCLVSSTNREDRVVKIGDFGLAKDIYKDDYYHKRGEGLFPVRWMAPESLVIGIFTSLSDVWSFGVLMWEITSLGEQPYAAKTNEEVINYVRAGGRLPMTLNCPSPLYQLMLRCWSTADARPNFKLCLENIISLRENMEDALLSPVDTF